MRNSKILLFILSVGLCHCSTRSKTDNLVLNTANLAAIGAGSVMVGTPSAYNTAVIYQDAGQKIQVSGAVVCSNEKYLNFKNYQLEFYNGEKLLGLIEIDQMGSFSKIYRSQLGDHLVKLVDKRSGKVLDMNTFKSTDKQDQFTISLKACPSPLPDQK